MRGRLLPEGVGRERSTLLTNRPSTGSITLSSKCCWKGLFTHSLYTTRQRITDPSGDLVSLGREGHRAAPPGTPEQGHRDSASQRAGAREESARREGEQGNTTG